MIEINSAEEELNSRAFKPQEPSHPVIEINSAEEELNSRVDGGDEGTLESVKNSQ